MNSPVFFITGNSRSGTTMMMRILNNHPLVHAINEPHFFEKMWSPGDSDKYITREEGKKILIQLLTCQREGFFASPKEFHEKYNAEANSFLENLSGKYTRLDIYKYFLFYETKKNKKEIPCDKTPQNIFYIKEILKYFPQTRIINMIRDPRSVMLSQKRKWKRKFLGGDFLTYKEMIRLKINYHPVVISKLWNAAQAAIIPFEEHPQVLNVRYEDLLENPEHTLKRICGFLNVPFLENILLIPHAGSSSERDEKDKLGIKTKRAKGWNEKGLNASEILICQQICKGYMKKFNYESVPVRSNPFFLSYLYISLPFKLCLSFVINLGRMRNIKDALMRRLTKHT